MNINVTTFFMGAFLMPLSIYSIFDTYKDTQAYKAYTEFLEEIQTNNKKDYRECILIPNDITTKCVEAKKAKDARDAQLMPRKKTVVQLLTGIIAPFIDRFIHELKTQEDRDVENCHKEMSVAIEEAILNQYQQTQLIPDGYTLVKRSTSDNFKQTQEEQAKRNAHWMPKYKTVIAHVAGYLIFMTLKAIIDKINGN